MSYNLRELLNLAKDIDKKEINPRGVISITEKILSINKEKSKAMSDISLEAHFFAGINYHALAQEETSFEHLSNSFEHLTKIKKIICYRNFNNLKEEELGLLAASCYYLSSLHLMSFYYFKGREDNYRALLQLCYSEENFRNSILWRLKQFNIPLKNEDTIENHFGDFNDETYLRDYNYRLRRLRNELTA